MLVEKSVPNTVRMPFLQDFFRPAYFIHIVPNGYAVSEGIHRKATPKQWDPSSNREEWPIEWCAEQWCSSLEIVERDRPQIERFLEIRYEDLTEKPGETLQRVSDFLGIELFPPDFSRRTWRIHGVESRISNMNRSSLQRLNAHETSRVTEVAKAELEEYGYLD